MWSMLAMVALVSGQTNVRLASPGLRGVNMTADELGFLGDHLAQQFSLQGIPVITQSEVGALLGLERQKELAGCTDAKNECLIELANAMGADGIVTGSIGKFSDKIQINVKVVRLRDTKTVALFSSRVGVDGDVLNELTRGAAQMAPAIAAAFNLDTGSTPVVTTTTSAPASAGPPKWLPMTALAVGAVAVAAGIGLFIAAGVTDGAVRNAGQGNTDDLTVEQARTMSKTETTEQVLGAVALTVGAAAAATGIVMSINAKQATRLTVAPTLGGLVLSGSFP
jgi:hypothetical protein